MKSGDASLALELEAKGYDWIKQELVRNRVPKVYKVKSLTFNFKLKTMELKEKIVSSYVAFENQSRHEF